MYLQVCFVWDESTLMVPFLPSSHKWDQQASVERVTAVDLDRTSHPL